MRTPGYTIIYPNRDKASSKATKTIVILFLLVSVGLMLIVTIGGWSKLQGLKPVNFAWCLVYLIIALLHRAVGSRPAADRGGAGDPAADPRADRGDRRVGHELVRPQSPRLRRAAHAVRRQGP